MSVFDAIIASRNDILPSAPGFRDSAASDEVSASPSRTSAAVVTVIVPSTPDQFC